MNIKPINYITKLSSPYQVGNSSYDYIGQLNITHISSIYNLKFHFKTFIRDFFINNEWSLDYSLHVNEAKLWQNNSFALLTCRDNTIHEKVIEKLDTLVYYNKRLSVQPSGFTNTQINTDIECVHYFFMLKEVNDFNLRLYPSYIKYELQEELDATDFNGFNHEPSVSKATSEKQKHEMFQSNDDVIHNKKIKQNYDDYLKAKLSNDRNTAFSVESNKDFVATYEANCLKESSETNKSTSYSLPFQVDKSCLAGSNRVIIAIFERMRELNKSLKILVNGSSAGKSDIASTSEANQMNCNQIERIKIINELRLQRQFLHRLIVSENDGHKGEHLTQLL